MRQTRSAQEERFRSLYADHYDPVLRFARRRADLSAADDVVAETFLVAWRRLHDVPSRTGEALPWLYAVARHCLLNLARSDQRQRAVAVRLADDPPAYVDLADRLGDRLHLVAAWRRLSADEQEVLALTVWEDLTSPQAGKILGISAAAYRVRLSRARRTLARHLDHSPSSAAAPAAPVDPAVPAVPTAQERVR